MLKLINPIAKMIARFNIYIGRATAYVSIINTMLIFLTFKSVYNINIPSWLIVIGGFVGVLLIGYIDYKIIALEQMKYINKRNDLKEDIVLIKKHLGIIEE